MLASQQPKQRTHLTSSQKPSTQTLKTETGRAEAEQRERLSEVKSSSYRNRLQVAERHAESSISSPDGFTVGFNLCSRKSSLKNNLAEREKESETLLLLLPRWKVTILLDISTGDSEGDGILKHKQVVDNFFSFFKRMIYATTTIRT